MVYSIELTDLIVGELKAIRAFDRRRIVDEINGQLEHQPTVETRNRKRLDAVAPDFEHVLPVWELRVGDYRVFYDVDEATQIVFVRAVRLKGHGQTTVEIIDERNDP
jgi:mRNA-degrading endonuclease RelE of RelBE toxin-antitoxin system